MTGEKICYNYFLARDAEAPVQNSAAAHMFARALPLFGDDAFTRFFAANPWIGRRMRIPKKRTLFPVVRALRGVARIASALLAGTLGDRIEVALKNWQMRRIGKKVARNSDASHLIMRDDAILLHYPDIKNKRVMERYERRMRMLESAVMH